MQLKTMRPTIISLFAVLALSLGSAAYAKTFKIASLSPDGSFWITTMKAAAKDIAKQTDDRVKFRFYPGGVMGNDKSVLKKIRIGQLQGAAFSSGALLAKAPDTQVYNIPLLFRSYDEVDYVRERMDAEVEATFTKAGFVNFGLAEGGFGYIMSKSRIASAGELKGNKVWVPSDDIASQAASDSFGIAPVSLSISDVLTGLQTGLIDTIAASPIAAIALQWHTQVDYLLDLPIIYIYALLAIDEKAFSKISVEDQAVVNKVMRVAFKKMDQQNRLDNQNAFEALEKQGIKTVSPDATQRIEWTRVGAEAAINFAKRGKIDTTVTDKVYRLLEEYRATQ
jgi:TRAP-type C4-dicarboxylate transport system substrate-binding protein